MLRIYLVFVGVNRDLAEWRFGKRDLAGIGRTIRYYLFLEREPAHTGKYNPLQKSTYYLIALLMIFQALTGFSLYWWENPFFAIVLGHVYMVFTEAYDRFLLMFFGIERKPAAFR